MSLIYSESFIAFGRSVNDDADTPENNDLRLAHAANLRLAGYDVHLADANCGLVVRDDPLFPARAALYNSCGDTVASDAVTAAFRREFPVNDKNLIFGFSVTVPVDYASGAAGSTPCLRLNAAVKSDAAWWGAAYTPVTSAKEIMRVSQDLLVRWGADAAQSSLELIPGSTSYIECRITASEVRCWLNDTLVMQKTVALVPQTVAFIFENNASGGSLMVDAPGRWAIGNMYYLFEDAALPNTRLGPKTRVLGSRPDSDVDTHYLRPDEFSSNASVVAQDLVPTMLDAVRAQAVDDFDDYGSGDLVGIGDALIVHAVASKVLAKNTDTVAHSIAGTVAGAYDAKARRLFLESAVVPFSIYDMAIRPGTTRIYAVGTNSCVYKSGVNYDITSWTRVYDDYTTSFICVGITFLASGAGCVARNSTASALVGGAPLIIAAGGDVVTAGGALSGTGAGLPAAIITTPDGRILVGRDLSSNTATVTTLTSVNGGTSWTALNTVISPAAPYTYGIAKMAHHAGRILATFNATNTRFWSNDNNGLTPWTQRSHGLTSYAINSITHDGLAWLAMGETTNYGDGGAPVVRRSVDEGVTWTAPSEHIGTDAYGAGGYTRGAISNTVTHESLFYGDGGAVVVTLGGLIYKQLPRLTGYTLRAAVLLPDGDFIVGGDGGVLLRYTDEPAAHNVAPLTDYQPLYNSAALNPATGGAWSAGDAAGAVFGSKVVA